MRKPVVRVVSSVLVVVQTFAPVTLATVTLATVTPAPRAWAAPSGGSVVAGSAQISASGATTTINQSSARAIINWQGFSTSAAESVRFNQPGATAVALNRVTGAQASLLNGRLDANGRVFLLNPNGIVFGATSQVNAAGLVASTLAMTDADFTAGRYRLKQDPAHALSAVVNDGRITATAGGSVALVAPVVHNAGTITAPQGRVALAGGTDAVVNLDSAGLVTLAVQTTRRDVVAPIEADSNLLASAVNNSNIVDAGSVSRVGGKITLGGAEGLSMNSGSIVAEGAAGKKGGEVTLASNQASIVAPGGAISVRGRSAGSAGGTVTVLSDGTSIHSRTATVDIQGGTGGAAGGKYELSGKKHIAFQGKVVAPDPGGKVGTVLLDPQTITIVTVGPAADDGQLNAGTPAGAPAGEILAGDSPGGNFTISQPALQGLPGGTQINLEATDSITVNDLSTNLLELAPGASLTLRTTNPAGFIHMIDPADVIETSGTGFLTVASAGTATLGGLSKLGNATGEITVSASGDISFRQLSAPGRSVVVTSSNGKITDENGNAQSVVADNATFSAKNSVGVSPADPIEIVITGNGALPLNASSTNGGLFFSQVVGGLNTGNIIALNGTAGDVNIQSVAGITLKGQIEGGKSVTLNAHNGTIFDAHTVAPVDVADIVSDSITLTTASTGGGGIGIVGDPIELQSLSGAAAKLSATASGGTGGGINIAAGSSLALTASGTNIDISAAGDITNTSVGSTTFTKLTATGNILEDTTDGSNRGLGGPGTIELHAGGNLGALGQPLLIFGPVNLTNWTATNGIIFADVNSDSSINNFTAKGSLNVSVFTAFDLFGDIRSTTSSVALSGGNLREASPGTGGIFAATTITLGGAGNAGTLATPIDIGAGTVNVTSAGEIALNGLGSFSVGSLVTVPNVQLSSVAGANITITQPIHASTLLRVQTGGTLIDANTTGADLTAPTIQLQSLATAGSPGTFGSAANPIETSTGDLAVNTNGGSAFLVNDQTVSLSDSAIGGNGDFNLTTAGDILMHQLRSGGNVSIQSTTGSLADSNFAAVNVQAPSATLIAFNGIGQGNGLETIVGTLSATTTTNDVTIVNSNGAATLDVPLATTGSGNVFISSTGAINVGTVTGTNVSLTGTNLLDRNGSAANITAGTATLSATAGGIASDTDPLETQVTSLSATAVNGPIGIAEADGLTTTALAAGGNTGIITIRNISGALTLNGVGGHTGLRVFNTGTDVTINGNGSVLLDELTTPGTGTVFAIGNLSLKHSQATTLNFSAGGSILDADGPAINVFATTASLNGNLTLGTVGTTADPIETQVTNLSASGKSIAIVEKDAVNLSGISASADISLTNGLGNITFLGPVVSGGNVSIKAQAGSLLDGNGNGLDLRGTSLVLFAGAGTVGLASDPLDVQMVGTGGSIGLVARASVNGVAAALGGPTTGGGAVNPARIVALERLAGQLTFNGGALAPVTGGTVLSLAAFDRQLAAAVYGAAGIQAADAIANRDRGNARRALAAAVLR